jgi:hypothetical protein
MRRTTMQNTINARAMATAAAANTNIDVAEENNITYWEAKCYDASLNALLYHAKGDMAEGKRYADEMRHARRMADAGIARRIGR